MDVSTATLDPQKWKEVDVGPVAQDDPVVCVAIDGRRCFRVRCGSGIKLLSGACPHMGGEVLDAGEHFECPIHGWTFDKATGRSLNAPGSALAVIETFERAGRLYAHIATTNRPARKPSPRDVADLSIQLVVHSSLQVKRDSFTLLTDPWLDGPAMLGSWTPYPPPLTGPQDHHPDAIWISHEHSDHFHEPTLLHFDRKTPIYFPDFPNQRIPRRLSAIGFTDLRAMPFGQRLAVAPGVFLTCYEPASLWNDSIVLIEMDGFRLLNLNDAGLNRRIADELGPVDAVASAFTPGASGYPLTWAHISHATQDDILQRACSGMLQMLREAVKLYGCASLLPYAGHFALWHPVHRQYLERMKKNSLDDVKNVLADLPVDVVDLFPGESWKPSTGAINRVWKNRAQLHDPDYLQKYLDGAFDESVFETHHNHEPAITAEDLDTYFLRLNEVPEIVFCEDLRILVAATDIALQKVLFECRYEIRDGKLTPDPSPLGDPPNLTMRIPLTVLTRIVSEDLSWDESHIGYWCEFSRSPDVFHGGFWRLLQAPYYHRATGPLPAAFKTRLTAQTSVGDVVERFGNDAERILRRYGMYCGGCHRASSETLYQAAATHGIDSIQAQRLLDELNSAFTLGQP